MDTFEFTLTVKFTLIHLNADLVCLCLHFLVGGIEHSSGAEVDDPANHVLVQSLDKIPDLRVNAEGIIGVSQEQNVYGLCNRAADRKRLCSDRLSDGFGKSLRVSGFCVVSDCYFHVNLLLLWNNL